MREQAGRQELIEFAFESRVLEGIPLATLLRMAQASRRFNAQSDLTGELHLAGESFRYVVEGACEVVQPLAARILADRRHASIRITAFGSLDRRRFDRWESFGFDPQGDPSERRAAGLIVLLPIAHPMAARRTAGFAQAR